VSGLQTIYVDFAARDREGRVYSARLSAFKSTPELGERFIGTDYDEFEHVECEVIGYDKVRGRVLHRPVNADDVPGTEQRPHRLVASASVHFESEPTPARERILVRA